MVPNAIQPNSWIGVGYSNEGAFQVMVLSEGRVRDRTPNECGKKDSPKSVR